MNIIEEIKLQKKYPHKIFSLIIILTILPLSIGCTNKFVTVKGEPLKDGKLETTAVKDWDKPSHMRELNNSSVDVVDLGLNKVSSSKDPRVITNKNDNCPAGSKPFLSTVEGQKIAKQTFRASGYGAPPARIASPMQKRLLAIRAAKMDAIRTLSERVSGMQIWGGSTLSDLALHGDRVHVYLDSFIQGAKVISTNHLEDGSYETTMGINFNSNIVNKLKLNRCIPDENPMKIQYNDLPLASVSP